jgi:hypothetical protein
MKNPWFGFLMCTLVASAWAESGASCTAKNETGGRCEARCEIGQVAFCQDSQGSSAPECRCDESKETDQGRNVSDFHPKANVVIGDACGPTTLRGRHVSLQVADSSDRSSVTMMICRLVKNTNENGYTISRYFEKKRGAPGESVPLGCFAPGYNEYHLVYSSARKDLQPGGALRARDVLESRPGKTYAYLTNRHHSKEVKIAYKLNGNKTFTAWLTPGAVVPIRTLDSAEYLFPYNDGGSVHYPMTCTHPQERSPTNPFPAR